MKKQSRSAQAVNVKVIADSAETLDGLHAYLGQFGLPCSGTRYLSDAKDLPTEFTAAVLFPDDFDPADVTEAVAALQRARPDVLVVLVTGVPRRFGGVTTKDGDPNSPVILAKPALGWTLVDLLRGHVVT